jgi:membrane protein implicated in regulation of membrane protease activity
MDWLRDHMWETWLAIAMVLGVAELFSLDLILLMLAAGALVGMVVALPGVPVTLQVLAAVAGSVAMLALVRPAVVQRLHAGPTLVQGHQKLVGQTATALSDITRDGGQVRVGGETWTARPYDEDAVIEAGSRVDIFEIQGATAIVHKIPELDS